MNRERYFWRWNTPKKYQTNIRAYYRMVTGIDNAIGRFRAALEEAGLADNTIIVYSADNGYHMGNLGKTTGQTSEVTRSEFIDGTHVSVRRATPTRFQSGRTSRSHRRWRSPASPHRLRG